jgi:uncharacterized protein YqgQ
MSLVDHEGGAEFQYAPEDVFDAVIEAVSNIKGFKVDKTDKPTGRIMVKAGISLMSWGENLPISITETSSGKTRVNIISTPKTGILLGGAMDFGKNRANIEKILDEVSKILQSKQPVKTKASAQIDTNDPIQRISKLKNLYDQGLIDEEEFKKKKEQIMSEI